MNVSSVRPYALRPRAETTRRQTINLLINTQLSMFIQTLVRDTVLRAVLICISHALKSNLNIFDIKNIRVLIYCIQIRTLHIECHTV